MSGEKWPYMLTYTGLHFDVENPRMEDIDIMDITVALSREARYNGHTKPDQFYSVAQHSVMCCDIVPREYQLWALLHDAAEAYVKDLTWTVKRLFPEYKVLENKIMRVIALKFDLEGPMPAVVKRADLIVLATERRDLLGVKEHTGDFAPLSGRIVPWPEMTSRLFFLAEFHRLTGVHVS